MSTQPVGDYDLDSDSGSLASCSTSPSPSPASSGFTSPATSPTASGFLIDKDENMSSTQEDSSRSVTQPTMGSDVQPTTESDSSCLGLENVGCPQDLPTMHFPSSLAANSEFTSSSLSQNTEPSNLSELQLSTPCRSQEQNSSKTAYKKPHFSNAQFVQKSKTPPASMVEHMPGISPPHLTASPPKLPPRLAPINANANDPPAHIPALCSPTLPSTPNIEQSPEWVDQPQRGEAEEREAPASYLVRQRQRARITIPGALSLTEPQSIPAYRPQAHHLYSYPFPGPSRGKLGALSRRVNVAPRALVKGLWDPWRKGGVLDRASLAEHRRRMRMWEDALREERALEAADEAESLSVEQDIEHGCANITASQPENEEASNVGLQGAEKDTEARDSREIGDIERDGSDIEQARAQDEALLLAVLVASLDSDACSSSDSSTITAPEEASSSDKSTEQDSDSMEVYVENGVQVAQSSKKAADDSSMASKDEILLQSDPTTPLAKYSERRPDLYSLSATHAFDWEAARGNRPPPLVSAVGNGASDNLRKRVGRAAVEDGDGGTPSQAPRKRHVRKKPWRQWILDLPSTLWDWICDLITLSNLPLPPPETTGRAIGGALHLIHFITRYSILRSHKTEEVGWEDMHREIHIVDGFEQEESTPWFSWTTPMTFFLLIGSLLNCLYMFTSIRSYQLHLRDNMVDSPRAKMVQVDMTTATRDMDNRPTPSLTWRLANALKFRLAATWKSLWGSKDGRETSREESRRVQQLDAWEPEELKMALFSVYSPAHSLLWMVFSSSTWFVALILMVVISGQIHALAQSYEGLLKDRRILNAEVMHEYNEKFVYPRIIPVRKDACVMTHEAEVVDWRH
ncbi:hypothetical protein FRC07_003234 [Ceratobasidium sp. 392]|nr:hypothetical protein FRC07_003234 [Ceratobasidium sp. 392]